MPAARRVLVIAVAASLLVTGAASARQQSDPAALSPMSDFYAFTGAPQTFVVPAGVTSVAVQAIGAQGFGAGAEVSDTLAVQPGQTLIVTVGGAPTAAGGYNGGGAGGAPGGSGGGGASDVRTGSDPATRLIVAGGGGGSSATLPIGGYLGERPSMAFFTSPGGGAAGAPGPAGNATCTLSLPLAIGQTVSFCGGGTLLGGGGGAAGANGVGGAGGTPGSGSATAGASGDAVSGGAGADGSGVAGGGGGGGGGYGGGGGGAGEVPPPADTGVDDPGVPIGQGGGGGGGGSYAPGGTIALAPIATDASVTITYTPPPAPPQPDPSAAANAAPVPAPNPSTVIPAVSSQIESVRSGRGGQAVLARIRCQAAPSVCRDRVNLVTHVVAGMGQARTTRVVVVGSSLVTIPKAHSASLTVPLNARGRGLLKQRGHLNVKVSVSAGQDPVALSSTLSLTGAHPAAT